jgi:hypothetical protein
MATNSLQHSREEATDNRKQKAKKDRKTLAERGGWPTVTPRIELETE